MLSTNCTICLKSGNSLEKINENDSQYMLKIKLQYIVPEVVSISNMLFLQVLI